MIEMIIDNISTESNYQESSQNNQEILKIDKNFQMNIFSQNFSEEKILICNKYEYIYLHKMVCYAQREIGEIREIVSRIKKFKNKKCDLFEKNFCGCTEPDCNELMTYTVNVQYAVTQ